MPAKYTQRNFVEGGFYHIYNKAKNELLFHDETDYKTFLFYLYIYVRPIKSVLQRYETLPFRLQIKNLNREVDILAYCLMPDHFHLIVRQTSTDGIQKLMKQTTNAYTEYYNKKYKKTGPVVQGRYKAVPLEKDKHLLALSRFIHLNPVLDELCIKSEDYAWSSLREFYDPQHEDICNKRIILSYYSKPKDYVRYVNSLRDYEHQLPLIENLTIDTI